MKYAVIIEKTETGYSAYVVWSENRIFLNLHRPYVPGARDNDLTRCREPWIHSGFY
jgi:hypothetical protein